MKNILFGVVLALLSSAAIAGPTNTVSFEWDPVIDDRVDHYVLGSASVPASAGATYTMEQWSIPYGTEVATVTLTGPSPNIQYNGVWYFAVKACNADESLCSGWSNEVQHVYQDGIPTPGNLKKSTVTYTFTVE
jgi:hypothetical protein